MRIETLPGERNVVRFPVERRARPSLALLREIAPDVREIFLIAESFDIDAPLLDLRERVDARTAQYITDQFGGTNGTPSAVLDEMLRSVVVKAVEACHAAHDVALEATQARGELHHAETAGGYWLDPLRERAEALIVRAAELTVAAHIASEEAEGVARAVGLARRGEPWRPRSTSEETEELIRTAV